MIGKPIALIQIPNQRAFRSKAAARYCGIDEDTLRKYTREGLIPFRAGPYGRRFYLLEDLDGFLESFPTCDNSGRSQPEPAIRERTKHV